MLPSLKQRICMSFSHITLGMAFFFKEKLALTFATICLFWNASPLIGSLDLGIGSETG